MNLAVCFPCSRGSLPCTPNIPSPTPAGSTRTIRSPRSEPGCLPAAGRARSVSRRQLARLAVRGRGGKRARRGCWKSGRPSPSAAGSTARRRGCTLAEALAGRVAGAGRRAGGGSRGDELDDGQPPRNSSPRFISRLRDDTGRSKILAFAGEFPMRPLRHHEPSAPADGLDPAARI